MKLGALIVKLIGFALEETETVLVRRDRAPPDKGAVSQGEARRKVGGER